MADSKSQEQLKVNRTTAKWQFSRLANNIVWMCAMVAEDELRDSFKKLTIEANKVMEANDDVGAGLDASEQQKADIKKTASECELKLKEQKDLTQKTLWANFGEEELTMTVKAVEEEAETVASLQSSGNKEAFDFMFDYLEGLIKKEQKSCTHSGSVGPSC